MASMTRRDSDVDKQRTRQINKILERPLPMNNREEDEVNILALALKGTVSRATTQTVPFTSLPAEIRNRIYEYALPSSEDKLIVATPFQDDLMAMGIQPAITKISRQVRSETLEMFYANTRFVAYVEDFEFDRLFRWVRAITSRESPRKVTVRVKLLDRIRCTYSLLDLMRAWRDLKHQTLHFRVHDYLGELPVRRQVGFDQRQLVARAIDTAEKLHQYGSATETGLLNAFHEQFEAIDREYLALTCPGNCHYHDPLDVDPLLMDGLL